jgi:hypothetical protein
MFCLICDKEIERLSGLLEEFRDPPNNAMVWISRGNYGSTEFDSVARDEQLEAYICDPCVAQRRHRIYYLYTPKSDPPQPYDIYHRKQENGDSARDECRG